MGTVCSGEACINGVCAPTDDAADESFGQTIAELEIGRQAGLYGDAVGGRFFSGTVLSCRDRKGASSCCRSEPVPQTSNTAFALYLNFGVSAAAPAAVLPAVPPAALPPKRRKQGCLSIPGHRQTAPQAPIEPRS